MALGDNTIVPAPPTIYAVYRGFYILPTDPLPNNAVAIDFFCTRSADNLTWEIIQYLGRGDNVNGLYFVHGVLQGLDENTYYAYHIQYIFSDGSKGPIGSLVFAGRAQLIITPTLNIDQLASRAYSTGLVTSGIFRGVIFQTSQFDPRVEMDPGGLFATDINGAKTFSLDAYTGAAIFNGSITGGSISIPPNFSVDNTGALIASSGSFTGTINSGSTINGSTIIGGTIETNSGAGARIILSSSLNSLTIYDSDGSVALGLDTSGGVNIVSTVSAQRAISWSQGGSTGFVQSGVGSVNYITVGSSGTNSQVTAQGGANNRLVISDNNLSDFVQTPNSQRALAGAGAGTVTFPGGQTSSNTTVITGVSFIASAVMVVTQSTSTGGLTTLTWSATYAGGNPATWNVIANSSINANPGAGTNINFYWLQMGYA